MCISIQVIEDNLVHLATLVVLSVTACTLNKPIKKKVDEVIKICVRRPL